VFPSHRPHTRATLRSRVSRLEAAPRRHTAGGGSAAVADFAAGKPFGEDRNLTAPCLHRRSAKNGIGTFAVLD